MLQKSGPERKAQRESAPPRPCRGHPHTGKSGWKAASRWSEGSLWAARWAGPSQWQSPCLKGRLIDGKGRAAAGAAAFVPPALGGLPEPLPPRGQLPRASKCCSFFWWSEAPFPLRPDAEERDFHPLFLGSKEGIVYKMQELPQDTPSCLPFLRLPHHHSLTMSHAFRPAVIP